MPRPLAAAIAVPAAAQAACGPIIVLFAGQVSVVGVAANIVAIPAIPLATTCGVLACLFGPLGGWWLEAPLRLAAVGSAWIAWVARWSTSLPGSVVAWPGGVVGAIGLIGATAGGVVGLIWVAKRRRRRWVAGAAAVCLAVAAVSPIGGNVRHAVGSLRGRGWAGDWQVAVCDVGQGTAVAIRAGPTSAVLVDTGPDDGGVGQCLDALGVERIPALILTHLHADHAGGLAEAIRGGRMPDTVLTPVACGQAGQEREVARVADKATVHALASSARNPSPVRGTAGIVTFEVFASALDTRCRAPATGRASSGTERVVNDASLAIHAAVGNVDTWVLGDLEDEGQRALARAISRGVAGPIASGPIASRAVAAEPMVSESEVAGPAAPRSADASSRTTTVAVVAHHGSAKQDDGLASLLAPDIAAFSVGADNGYGHPAASALAMYARVGAAIVRTDEDGHIAIRADGTVAGERTGVAREATAGSPAESLPTGGQ
jgi:competence protein ComEC